MLAVSPQFSVHHLSILPRGRSSTWTSTDIEIRFVSR
jgi:hypothetical protein